MPDMPLERAALLTKAFGELLSAQELLVLGEKFPALGALPENLGDKAALAEKLLTDESIEDGRAICLVWRYVSVRDRKLSGPELMRKYTTMGTCIVHIPYAGIALNIEVHLPVVDWHGSLAPLDEEIGVGEDGIFSVGGYYYQIDPFFNPIPIKAASCTRTGTLRGCHLAKSDKQSPCAKVLGSLPARYAELDLHVECFKEALVRCYRSVRDEGQAQNFIDLYEDMLGFFTSISSCYDQLGEESLLVLEKHHPQLERLHAWGSRRLAALKAKLIANHLGGLIQDTAAEICRRFNPADHLVIILGRDCLPIYEVVRRMDPTAACYVEISRRVIEDWSGVKRVVSSIKRLANGRQVVVIDSGFAGRIMAALEANGLELTGYLLSTSNPSIQQIGSWTRAQVDELEDSPKNATRAVALADDLTVERRETGAVDSGIVDPVLCRYFLAVLHRVIEDNRQELPEQPLCG